MTKAKLARLIELERTCSRIGDLVPGALKRELEALRAEFTAWEPELRSTGAAKQRAPQGEHRRSEALLPVAGRIWTKLEADQGFTIGDIQLELIRYLRKDQTAEECCEKMIEVIETAGYKVKRESE